MPRAALVGTEEGPEALTLGTICRQVLIEPSTITPSSPTSYSGHSKVKESRCGTQGHQQLSVPCRMTATNFLMPLLVFSGPQAKPKMSGGRALPDFVLSEGGTVSSPCIALMSLRSWGAITASA